MRSVSLCYSTEGFQDDPYSVIVSNVLDATTCKNATLLEGFAYRHDNTLLCAEDLDRMYGISQCSPYRLDHNTTVCWQYWSAHHDNDGVLQLDAARFGYVADLRAVNKVKIRPPLQCGIKCWKDNIARGFPSCSTAKKNWQLEWGRRVAGWWDAPPEFAAIENASLQEALPAGTLNVSSE